MEIAHLGKYYWPECGGIETATKNLAEIGVELGHRVSCVVSGSGMGQTVLENVGSVSVIRHPLWAKLLSAPVSPRLLTYGFAGVDVLHLHLPHPMAELAVLKLLVNPLTCAPRIIPFLHATPLSQGNLGKLWFSSITARILDRAEIILVSNDKFTDAFSQLKRWRERFRVLPFQVDVWTDEQFAAEAVQRLSSRRALAVGRLVPYKGFDLLIRAWAQACAESAALSRFELTIIGSGAEAGRLKALITERGMDQKIRLLGHCSDTEKERLLAGSELFLAPSVTDAETFGISILEAFARGLPTITTRLQTGVSVLSRGGAPYVST